MLIEPSEKNYVTKSEKLLKARYELSEVAIKLIAIFYSNIKRSDEIGKDYEIRVADIAKLLNKNYGELYNEIKEAVEELMSNPVFIPDDDNPKNYTAFNWIADARYKDGIIAFTISKRLKPYVLGLQEKFLKYRLENILPLRSKYVIKLYEILKDIYNKKDRYGNKAEKILKISEFREILEIPKSYQYSSHIKKLILEKAKRDFIENTDILFEFEELKTGRKITHLKFIIKPNPKKLQTDNRLQDAYFNSRKNFVTLLRKNYSGNGKFWGYKTIDGQIFWLGLDKNGLIYATNGKDIKDFNGVESAELYDLWLKIAQNSNLYRQLIEQGVCLKDIAENNKELWLDLKEDIIRLKEEGII
ncbi:MAG: replication initiation protein [Nautiliaceae bacterium]